MTQDRPAFKLPPKNKPYIKKAIRILDELSEDIPYMDKAIEYLILAVGKKFATLEIKIVNGAPSIVKTIEITLMKQ